MLMDTHQVVEDIIKTGLNKEQAEVITKAINQSNNNLVTKNDLKTATEKLNSKIDSVKTQVDSVKSELNSKIDSVKREVESVKSEVNSKIDSVRSEIGTMKWMLGLLGALNLMILSIILSLKF